MVGAPTGIRTVIFDLDGTLVDSAPDIHATANRALQAAGLSPLPFKAVRAMIGRGVPVLIDRLLAAHGQAADSALRPAIEASFARHYASALALSQLYPGVASALEALSAQGINLGICTNKPLAATRAVLAHFDLTPFFAAVVGGDSLPVRKPDPAPLHLCLQQLSADRAQTLYVGDSEVDAATAQAAALPFALFTQGYRHTDVAELPHSAQFDRFSDLTALISRLTG